jgi:hypothetical protein
MARYGVIGSGVSGFGMAWSIGPGQKPGLFYCKKKLTFVMRMRYIALMSSPTSIRLGEAGVDLLVKLSKLLGLKRSAVIELAIRELAKRHKIV